MPRSRRSPANHCSVRSLSKRQTWKKSGPTYIALETLQMIGTSQSSNKLAGESLATLLANASRAPRRLGIGPCRWSRSLSWVRSIALIRLIMVLGIIAGILSFRIVLLLDIVTRRLCSSIPRRISSSRQRRVERDTFIQGGDGRL